MDNSNWSLEAIQERAANNWSLECDNQLLNLMKSMSKNLEQRCITSNNNLNRLMLDVDKTKVKLGNTTTKFLDLNNAKFVEHTVMDSSLTNVEKCSTADDKTFVPLPKAIEEAVTNGLNMMDRCYEKVLLDLEDSDEEDNESGHKHVVCRPKNSYLNRPLPHLIGSKQWNDKWHVGLIESDEEVLSEDEVEEFSQSSEDGDSISISPPTSNPPTASESDFPTPTQTVLPQTDLFHNLSNDVEVNSPLFATDFQANREKIKVLPTIAPSTETVPKNESNNNSKSLAQPSVPSSEQPKESIFVPQKTEKKYLNLFDDEPPLLNEPIISERKAVNLFLDSDDEDDPVTKLNKKPTSIFNNNVVSRPTLPTSSDLFPTPQLDNIPKAVPKTVFNDDVDNNNVPVASKSDIKPTPKSNNFGGLFDDEPPDDFFDIIVREKGGKIDDKKPEKSKLQTKTVNLFESDDDDDDDFSKIIGTSRKNDSSSSLFNPSITKDSVENRKKKESSTVLKNDEKPNISQPQGTYSPYISPFRSSQNTGPPKSYVSFLDDEAPSFDEDKEEKPAALTGPQKLAKSLFDEPPQKSLFDEPPPKSLFDEPQRKSLFDEPTPTSLFDEPPPKSFFEEPQRKSLFDEPVSKSLFDEPPTKSFSNETEQKNLFDEPPPKSLFDELPRKNLFDESPRKSLFDEAPPNDIPTDDRIVRPVISTRKSHSKIIYDDISETLAAKPTLSDHSQFTIAKNNETKSDVSHTRDETDQSLTFKKNLSMFSNPDMAKLPVIEKESKPKPNKLKPNFNINVAALLPGARLPSQKQPVTTKQEEIEKPETEKNENIRDEEIQSSNIARAISHPTSTEVENASGRLTCISKSRPKIQIQRKPSTRKGRQRLYNNSLIAEEEKVEESNETTDSGSSKKEIASDPIVDVMPQENILKTDIEDDDWLSKATTNDQPPPFDSHIANVDDEEDDWLKPSSPIKTTLDEDDWMSSKVINTEQKAPNQNVSHVMNFDWLTASSLPPEDINPPASYPIDDYHEQDDWLSSYVAKEKSAVDLPNHEDDWLASPVGKEKQQQSSESILSIDNTKQDDYSSSYVTKEKSSDVVHLSDHEDDWLTSSVTQEKERQSSESILAIDNTKQDDWLSESEPIRGVISSGFNTKNDHVQTTTISESEQVSGVVSSSNVNTIKEDDWLSPTATISKSVTISDVNEDWYTQSLPHTSTTEKRKISVSDVLSSEFGAQNSNIFESRDTTKKSLNASLFDDYEDDDDDLFTSTRKPKSVSKQTNLNKTEAVKTTKNVSIKAKEKSLFSDDDSDSDDLFGSAKSTIKQKENKPKDVAENLKVNPVNKRTGGGLFDDEDDDDTEDIFSSKIQKHRVNRTAKNKKPSVTKLVATIPASNDPLADLLK